MNYVVTVQCENCGERKVMEIKKGQEVQHTKCVKCGCEKLRRK